MWTTERCKLRFEAPWQICLFADTKQDGFKICICETCFKTRKWITCHWNLHHKLKQIVYNCFWVNAQLHLISMFTFMRTSCRANLSSRANLKVFDKILNLSNAANGTDCLMPRLLCGVCLQVPEGRQKK